MSDCFEIRLDSFLFQPEHKKYEDERLAWEFFERFKILVGEQLHIIDTYGNILMTRIG